MLIRENVKRCKNSIKFIRDKSVELLLEKGKKLREGCKNTTTKGKSRNMVNKTENKKLNCKIPVNRIYGSNTGKRNSSIYSTVVDNHAKNRTLGNGLEKLTKFNVRPKTQFKKKKEDS